MIFTNRLSAVQSVLRKQVKVNKMDGFVSSTFCALLNLLGEIMRKALVSAKKLMFLRFLFLNIKYKKNI